MDDSDNSESDYEEEDKRKPFPYEYSLNNYTIDFDIKTAISRKLKDIEIKELNYTILVAALIILIKNNNKITTNFSVSCDEVIEDVIKNDISFKKTKLFDKNLIKRDILRYCRYVLRWTK